MSLEFESKLCETFLLMFDFLRDEKLSMIIIMIMIMKMMMMRITSTAKQVLGNCERWCMGGAWNLLKEEFKL